MPEPTNPYDNPDAAVWLGSFEGVPDVHWPHPTETAAEQAAGAVWQRYLNQHFSDLGAMLPGIGLALGLAFAGKFLAQWLGVSLLGFTRSPISAILVAIVLGLIVRNIIGLPGVYENGLRLCLKKVLRIGVALLGIRLSLVAAGQIGLIALPIVLGCIISALVLVSWINNALGLPRRLGSLIAVGTSICGVSAIVATAPGIDAKKEEVSYAVSCVALFGMIALFVYPFLSHWMFADAQSSGFFLGTAIHDTSQVAGAGLMYQQLFAGKQSDAAAALDTAVVTKLVRNLCMVWVIPMMAILYHRNGSQAGGKSPAWYKLIPLFVVGFVAMILLRTLGDLNQSRPFGLFEPQAWEAIVVSVKTAAEWCLIVAMAAVGLGTSFAMLRNLGIKPFAVGLAAASLVGVVSFGLIRLLTTVMG